LDLRSRKAVVELVVVRLAQVQRAPAEVKVA
jgi:hypothetical protein